MNNEKIRAIFLAAVMVVSMAAVGAAPAAAQDDGEINIAFEPTDAEVDVDGEETYDVVFEGADNGMSSYDFEVEIDDVGVAEITDAELAFGDGFEDVTFADDNSSVELVEAMGDDTTDQEEFTVATVTVTGESEGDTELSIADGADINDLDSVQYDIADSGTAAVTVADDDNGDDDDDDVQVGDINYADFDGVGIDVIFQGQDVFLVGDAIEGETGETVNLRQVDSFDDNEVESSSQVEQLEVEDIADLDIDTDDGVFGDFDQAAEIETGDLDADDYFVRGLDGLPTNPDEEDTFEVTIQDITVEFDDAAVTDGGPDSDTDLDIDSDRGTYSVNASIISAPATNTSAAPIITSANSSATATTGVSPRSDVSGRTPRFSPAIFSFIAFFV